MTGVQSEPSRCGSPTVELSGPVLAEGYLGDEALTAEKFPVSTDGQTARRWYRTNDAGEVTDGVVSVFGRLDNVIISGGVKVSLDRVERAVQAVPGFADALVVPAPSEKWGQVSVVVVARETGRPEGAEPPRSEGAADDAADAAADVAADAAGDAARQAAELARIRSAVTAAAGREAAPARILTLSSLPLLSSGKPDRRELARLAAAAGD
jgi:O-succinylbenzoic acid--CoA ligase